MANFTIRFDLLERAEGNCDECGEPLDTDRQTIGISVKDHYWMMFHQVCAWKRATFIFGELF